MWFYNYLLCLYFTCIHLFVETAPHSWLSTKFILAYNVITFYSYSSSTGYLTVKLWEDCSYMLWSYASRGPGRPVPSVLISLCQRFRAMYHYVRHVSLCKCKERNYRGITHSSRNWSRLKSILSGHPWNFCGELGPLSSWPWGAGGEWWGGEDASGGHQELLQLPLYGQTWVTVFRTPLLLLPTSRTSAQTILIQWSCWFLKQCYYF